MPEFIKSREHRVRTGIFISYARSDGESLAERLRERLKREMKVWQDRTGMEGGRDWWLQITEALNNVEFMVLVMTPDALRSETVRKEWRYARQQGVCVYPLQGEMNLDFKTLPRWMRGVHFYDIDREWTKFINDLNTGCQTPRVPFMVEDLPDDFVARPKEFELLVSHLLQQQDTPVAITAALRGAGGYGKTTIAKALCHHEEIQEAFDDGILWVTLGRDPGELIGRVEDLIYTLSGERPGFTTIDAATARFVELLADRDVLIVIDDVWNAAHLRPFLQGGPRCARLITTRNLDTLPANAKKVHVDAMEPDEALSLCSAGLPYGSEREMAALVNRLGEWPLLLKLANGTLRKRVLNMAQALPDALAYVNRALDKRGLTFFDARNPEARHQAVKLTLSVSFELLSADERARYSELAVFPEDVEIPLIALTRFWNQTGGLEQFDCEDLCDRLYQLSLLVNFDPTTHRVRIHDVLRNYLIHEQGDALLALHCQLLQAYRSLLPLSSQHSPIAEWATLPADEPYLWSHLAYHLREAGHLEELVATVKDLRYLAIKTFVRKASEVEADLQLAERHVRDDGALPLVRRSFVQCCHLLERCDSIEDLIVTLHSRLQHLSELATLTEKLAHDLPRPYIAPWHPFPELPHPALIRTLSGHKDMVMGCAISPDGSWIVSASSDRTLRIWEAESGEERLTLRGHTSAVNGCAISSDGARIVSASADKTLKVWDGHTGRELQTLFGHTEAVYACAFSPDNSTVVSAGKDTTLRIWDIASGEPYIKLSRLKGNLSDDAVSKEGQPIRASWNDKLCIWDVSIGGKRIIFPSNDYAINSSALSEDGSVIALASYYGSNDKTLKVWDAHTGVELLTLDEPSSFLIGCAISADNSLIVTTSGGGMLRVWDAESGAERQAFFGHTSYVICCAISPDGSWIVSGSGDRTLKVWDTRSESTLKLPGHTACVNDCAISADGSLCVSASDDKTLKIWNPDTGAQRLTLSGHLNHVVSCAMSADGSVIISTSEDGSLRVWDAASGNELRTFLRCSPESGCAISADGSVLIMVSGDNTLEIRDTQSSTILLSGQVGKVARCLISADGSIVVCALGNWTLIVSDAYSGKQHSTLTGHTNWVSDVAISADCSKVVSASWDKTVKVWDARSGKECMTLLGHKAEVTTCAISSNGSWIASASDDKTLKVWETDSGRCLTTLNTEGVLRKCAWFRDGKHIMGVGGAGVYFFRLGW